jgi:hypothetical protein
MLSYPILLATRRSTGFRLHCSARNHSLKGRRSSFQVRMGCTQSWQRREEQMQPLSSIRCEPPEYQLFQSHHQTGPGSIPALSIRIVRYKGIVDGRAEVGTRSRLRLHEIQGAFSDVHQSSRHASRQLPKAHLLHRSSS